MSGSVEIFTRIATASPPTPTAKKEQLVRFWGLAGDGLGFALALAGNLSPILGRAARSAGVSEMRLEGQRGAGIADALEGVGNGFGRNGLGQEVIHE